MKYSRILVPVLSIFLFAGCFGGIYAPPPPDRVEVVGVAPGPGFVWVGGYWVWRGGVHAWVPGTWRRPPYPGAVWIAPRWHRRYGRYYFREGHWR